MSQEPPPAEPVEVEVKHLPASTTDLFKNSNITPSEYATQNEKLNIILFNRIHKTILDNVKNDNFEKLQTFRGEPPVNAFPEILELVDSLNMSQLVDSKKKLLNDFVTFLRQKIPAKIASSIARHWGPVIPKYVDNVTSVLHIIIRLANEAKDGNKILYWLSNSLFQKTWGKKSSLMNSKIGAVCRCILPPAKKAYWAILGTDKTFKLYLLKKNAAVLDFECKVSRTRVHEDNKSVVITDDKGVDVKTFLPVDINQAQMWGAALAKQHAPFPYYFSSFLSPLPAEYYHALYEAITCNDMIIVRCVTDPSVTPPEDPLNRGTNLMDSLFDIFAHSAKMPMLINQMVATEIYDAKSSNVLRKPSNCGNLVNIFTERFGGQYYSKFVSKLIDYVKSKDCFGQGLNADAADLEVPLNTAFKLIYNSADLVPRQIKHFAQVLFSYAAIKYNNKQDVYNVLANFFFFRFLFSIIKNADFFGGDAAENKNVKGFIDIAKVVCQFGKLEDGLDGLNKRFQHNVYPNLEKFLFSISQITDAPKYDGVTKERFVKIIENVLCSISFKGQGKNSDSFIQFVQRFNDAALATFKEPLVLQHNIHVALSQFFHYRFDPEIQEIADKGENIDAEQYYFKPPPPDPSTFAPPPSDLPPMPGPAKGSGAKGAKKSGAKGGAKGAKGAAAKPAGKASGAKAGAKGAKGAAKPAGKASGAKAGGKGGAKGATAKGAAKPAGKASGAKAGGKGGAKGAKGAKGAAKPAGKGAAAKPAGKGAAKPAAKKPAGKKK
jgi:hypothetical protein